MQSKKLKVQELKEKLAKISNEKNIMLDAHSSMGSLCDLREIEGMLELINNKETACMIELQGALQGYVQELKKYPRKNKTEIRLLSAKIANIASRLQKPVAESNFKERFSANVCVQQAYQDAIGMLDTAKYRSYAKTL